MMVDELVMVSAARSRLSPTEALSQALEGAALRGQPTSPAVILECLPDGWGIVDTLSVGALAETLLDSLGTDGWLELRQCPLSPGCDGWPGHPYDCA
jgi:hypothetical protein